MSVPYYRLIILGLMVFIGVWMISDSELVCTDQNSIRHEMPESSALEAMEFWTEQRAYPNSYINEQQYASAFEEEMPKLKGSDKGLPPWESMGPANRGGRMLAMAFNPLNPETIYAGSASGGLWRSYSGGVGYKSWERVNTGHPVLGVGSIAFMPGDSNTIFIGTGEVYRYEQTNGGVDVRTYRGSYGNGILRSIDGGVSWEKVLDWDYSEKHGVQVIKVNPQRPATVWAGTSHGLYRSTDSGETWDLIEEVIMVTDIEINPIDTNKIYMACGNFFSTGHGIYSSIDGGDTWLRVTEGLPPTYGGKALLSMSPNHPEIIYAGIGNGYTSTAGTWLCKTSNGGRNWRILNDTNYAYYQGWFAHDVAVHPVNPDTLFCFGLYGWRSVDGGESLNQITSIGVGTNIHVDFHALLFKPGSPSTMYIASDGGIYRTEDLGESFDRLDNGLLTSQFYNGFSNSSQNENRSLGGLQDNGTYRFDGDDTWVNEWGGDGAWTAFDPIDDNIFYVSSQYLRMARTDDGGANFRYIVPPEYGAVSFIAPFLVAPGSPHILYAGRSNVYKSFNRGNSWNPTNSGNDLDENGNPVLSMAVSYQTSNTLYAATAPRYGPMNLFISRDGGNSWTNIKGTLPERYPVDMAVNPLNDAVVYVVLSGFGSGHLYKSIDYGITWINISDQLPDIPSSAIAVDPLDPDHLFFGNDLGVYYSSDGGELWSPFSNGLPEAVIVKDLTISTVNRKLRVATHGNGAYEIKLPLVSSVEKTDSPIDRINLYPNPVSDIINVEYLADNDQPGKVSIYSYDGTVVYFKDHEFIGGQNILTIENLKLPAGIYFLEIRQGKQISRSKILKIN